MKNAIALVFSLGVIGFAQSQTVAQCISAIYGYPNIPKDSVVLHTMFGITKYAIYADEKYMKVETYQDLDPEEAKKIGPTLRTVFIKDKSMDKTFLCVSFDTLHIMMEGGDKGRESLQQIMSAYNTGSDNIYNIGGKTSEIQGLKCNELFMRGRFVDTIPAFVTNQISLDPGIRDFRMYVNSAEPERSGLLMGRDEMLWYESMIEFRAVKLEINQRKDIPAELATYRRVSEAEGEKEMKAMFSKLMGFPAEGGKN